MWFTIFTYEIIKYHRIANIKMEKKEEKVKDLSMLYDS